MEHVQHIDEYVNKTLHVQYMRANMALVAQVRDGCTRRAYRITGTGTVRHEHTGQHPVRPSRRALRTRHRSRQGSEHSHVCD